VPSEDDQGRPGNGLVRHAGERDNEASVASWYRQYGGAVMAFATGLTGDRTSAQDVLQETFVRAWQRAGTLSEADGSILPWLFTVARNIVIDQKRAKARRPLEVEQTPETAPHQPDEAERVVDSLVAVDALRTLSDEHRAVLELLYFNDLSVAQAAKALNIPPGTVKSRAHYALRALHQVLVAP
jgi:RNA polymerase sigma-70 factor (ECF subfamily)